MNRWRKSFVFLIALTFVWSSCIPVTVQAKKDELQAHWAKSAMDRWVSTGIIKGYSDGAVKPNNPLSLAEALTIINRVLGGPLHTDDELLENTPIVDVRSDAWYFSELLKAQSLGYVQGFPTGSLKPERKATREEAAMLLAQAFELQYAHSSSSAAYLDASKISLYAKSALEALLAEGVLNGYADGSLRPHAGITRAEFITMLDRIVEVLLYQPRQYSDLQVTGNAVINKAGVALAKSSIEGNLYLTSGIGEGEAVLNDVKVAGNVFIAGGGDHSIVFRHSTLNKAVVNKRSLPVRIVSSDETRIGQLLIEDSDVLLEGEYEEVYTGANSKITILPGASIKKLILAGEAQVIIQKAAVIAELLVEEAAEGAVIASEGTIKTSSILAGIEFNGSAIKAGQSLLGTASGIINSFTPSPNPSPSPSPIPTPEPKPDYVIAEFTFDEELEGWESRSHFQAGFPAPTIEHSTAVGGGALQINAQITEISKWQDLKLWRSIPDIGQATTVTFDVYMDMSLFDLQLYGNVNIKPYIAVDPGWIRFGQNDSVSKVSELERVVVDGKEYGKLQVYSRLVGGHEAGDILNVVYTSDGLMYNGPIYIDNIKVLNKPLGGEEGEAPGVLPDNSQPLIDTQDFDKSPVKLVDRNATAETRSLFAYLTNISGNNLLFGHQNSTTRGVTITKNNGTQSDVKDSVGAFPAVYGWDTNSLEGYGEPYTIESMREVMRLAYERNGIITLSSHMPNFVSGGNFNDKTRVVEHILPGGSHHQQYLAFLDNIAELASGLVDSEGTLIPVIFRPFHEHNGSWFWWGAQHAKNDEYMNIYRFTVEYLRDIKQVRNFLYAFSPNGFFNGDPEQYLYRYPGDEYVDVLGFDIYDSSYNQLFRDQLVQDSRMLSQLAEDKGKIAAITELGVSNGHSLSGNPNLNWWTDWLNDLKADEGAKRIAYALTWTNSAANSFWVPFRNHPLYGNHEMLDDFISFYNDDFTAFGDRLTGVYNLDVQADPAAEPYFYVVSPTNNTIVKGPITIRAGTYNDPTASVAYSINNGPGQLMNLNPLTGYYEAEWIPAAEHNGQTVTINVKASFTNGAVLERQLQATILMESIVKELDFADPADANWFSNGGTYKAGFGVPAMQHNAQLEALQLNADISGSNINEAWQELKVKVEQIQSLVPLSGVNKVKFDILIPTASLPEALNQNEVALLPNIYLFPTTSIKYGTTNAKPLLSDLPRVTLSGEQFAKHSVSIEMKGTDKDSATAMVFAIVFKKLEYTGPIYLDNIQFIYTPEEAPSDPSVLDNFENFDGDNSLLREVYTNAGDVSKISLVEAPKHSGSYAMKFDYQLASNGYTGVIKTYGNADWSVYSKLKFWYKPDDSGQKLVVQIRANGIPFEIYPSLLGTEEQLVEIPFSEFHPAPHAPNQSAVLDAAALKKVERFGIYVNAASPGYTGSGTLYFDDIRLTVD